LNSSLQDSEVHVFVVAAGMRPGDSLMAPIIENEIFDRLESNVCSYARSFPAIFSRASGSELWDQHGTRYLDFLAGAGSLNYGHNQPQLKQALLDYISDNGIAHSLDLHTDAKEAFLETFEKAILQPRSLDYVVQFTGPTGANAVEAALKLARKATGRTNVIYFTNAFHGVSLGALAVTGNQHFRGAAGAPLQGGTVVPYDKYLGRDFDTIDYLEKVLTDPSSGVDAPAAVILELVQGEGGLNVASALWFTRLARLCKSLKILLIVDDIQAGCGRTGSFFSFDGLGVKPDIVTLSKSLSGFGLPMSVVLINREIDVWKPAEHNGTFRGNNHAFVTATATLKTFWSDDNFKSALDEKSNFLKRRLEKIVDDFSPNLLAVKGRGLMQGILCADPEEARKIASSAFAQGLIIERAGPSDEVIKCMMPLTTSFEQMEEGLAILEKACGRVVGARPATRESAIAVNGSRSAEDMRVPH
jgi:diaminobutyrate-2-oxoglutarate transaminase